MNVMADVTPAKKGDTLPLCLAPLMESIGHPEWSVEILEGILGHAFHFEMAEGGKHVNHDNIDWGPALDSLPDLAEFLAFDAHIATIDLATLKQEARIAVRASLKKGYAALVWQPMSVEMEVGHHHGFCWGLIVGYNEADESYTIRHPYVPETYTIRYDALGQTGAEWFNIQVVDEPRKIDTTSIHVTALKNAIAFAHQTRFAADDKRNAKRRARPHGFAAYRLWHQAFEFEEISLEASLHHTEVLIGRRLAATTYLRKLIAFFPEAATSLELAATNYDRELDFLRPLFDLCKEAKEKEVWHKNDREEARNLIEKALEADQDAIKKIEHVLSCINRTP